MLHRSCLVVAPIALAGALTAAAWAQDPSVLYSFRGGPDCVRLGYDLANAGDVDRDGFADIFLGSWGGCARLYSGLTGALLHEFDEGTPFAEFGFAVDGAGDVNADGVPDLIVGGHADDAFGADSGRAWVFSGQDGNILQVFHGDAADDHFGAAVAGAGDVNADGYDDVIVGAAAPIYPIEPRNYARVFSGSDGSVLHTFLGNPDEGDRFGLDVAGAGDVDGDGYDDLLVGAPMENNGPGSANFWTGAVRLYSGRTGALLAHWFGDATYDFLGTSVAGAGDVNADGVPDIAAGAWGNDVNGDGAGMVRVYSGADASVLHTFHGDSSGDRLWVVGAAGDVNGDGYDDILMGAPYESTYNYDAGMARVVSGLDGSILAQFYGTDYLGNLGWALDGAGDLSGDGVPELLISAPFETDGIAGVVRVNSVTPLPLSFDAHALSLSGGGTQSLLLAPGIGHGGHYYALLGSASGVSPGTPAGNGHTLPLRRDNYFNRTLFNPYATPLVNARGVLDSYGIATAHVFIPAGSPSSFVGRTLFHAYALQDPATAMVVLTSNPAPVTLLP
ncbi:MAG: hypothetical protein EYC70_15385 [Planctomycetota bacterium]|nr:MAG: hypothetical protein EYC70_15385 [Planctomycetota bacterium]